MLPDIHECHISMLPGQRELRIDGFSDERAIFPLIKALKESGIIQAHSKNITPTEDGLNIRLGKKVRGSHINTLLSDMEREGFRIKVDTCHSLEGIDAPYTRQEMALIKKWGVVDAVEDIIYVAAPKRVEVYGDTLWFISSPNSWRDVYSAIRFMSAADAVDAADYLAIKRHPLSVIPFDGSKTLGYLVENESGPFDGAPYKVQMTPENIADDFRDGRTPSCFSTLKKAVDKRNLIEY